MKSRFAILLGSLLVATSAGASGAGQTLELSLVGIQHARGAIRVGLYSDPASFRKEASAHMVKQVAAEPGTVVVRFEALPPGRYAIMAYHDEDGNGEMNRRLGMFPTEGYGLSNNPAVIGPPAFDDSAFEVRDTPVALHIDVRY